ncbi:MAG: ABC transporter ATP-binding protein [Lachnospiraceae bacterium]|jgi:peptide/nickel transport system ATP-binding protein/oligopeptide transport system ATP-binding protein
MDTSDTVLEVKGLKVDFKVSPKESLTAIRDVTFSIHRGETLGVVGESGCGKSVTANSIMQLLPKRTSRISDGSILFDGKNLVGATEKEMRDIRGRKISMIFQDPMTSLNPVYRVGDQLVEMYKAHEKITKKEAWERGTEMLREVGIPSPETRMFEYPHEMSGGMRQRVMIAMALSARPELLIADEPTTALDVTIQAQVLDLMKDLRKSFNTAVMLITHDMGVVAENSDCVLVMYAGEAVEYADVKTIFTAPRHPYTQGLLASLPRVDRNMERLHTIEGTVPSLADMPEGCRFCTRCPYATDKCRTERPELTESGGHPVRCFYPQVRTAD